MVNGGFSSVNEFKTFLKLLQWYQFYGQNRFDNLKQKRKKYLEQRRSLFLLFVAVGDLLGLLLCKTLGLKAASESKISLQKQEAVPPLWFFLIAMKFPRVSQQWWYLLARNHPGCCWYSYSQYAVWIIRSDFLYFSSDFYCEQKLLKYFLKYQKIFKFLISKTF